MPINTKGPDSLQLLSISNRMLPLNLQDDTTSVNSNALYFTEFMANTEWTVIASESTKNVQYYSCCPEPYQDIVFSITVQRNSPSYVCCVILPICSKEISIICIQSFPIVLSLLHYLQRASGNSFFLYLLQSWP